MKPHPFDAFDFVPDDYLFPREEAMKITLQVHYTEDAVPERGRPVLLFMGAERTHAPTQKVSRIFGDICVGKAVASEEFEEGWGFAQDGCEPEPPDTYYAWADLPDNMPQPRQPATVEDYEEAIVDALSAYEKDAYDFEMMRSALNRLYNRFPALRKRAQKVPR